LWSAFFTLRVIVATVNLKLIFTYFFEENIHVLVWRIFLAMELPYFLISRKLNIVQFLGFVISFENLVKIFHFQDYEFQKWILMISPQLNFTDSFHFRLNLFSLLGFLKIFTFVCFFTFKLKFYSNNFWKNFHFQIILLKFFLLFFTFRSVFFTFRLKFYSLFVKYTLFTLDWIWIQKLSEKFFTFR